MTLDELYHVAKGTAVGYGGQFDQPLQTRFGLIFPHSTAQVRYFIL